MMPISSGGPAAIAAQPAQNLLSGIAQGAALVRAGQQMRLSRQRQHTLELENVLLSQQVGEFQANAPIRQRIAELGLENAELDFQQRERLDPIDIGIAEAQLRRANTSADAAAANFAASRDDDVARETARRAQVELAMSLLPPGASPEQVAAIRSSDLMGATAAVAELSTQQSQREVIAQGASMLEAAVQAGMIDEGVAEPLRLAIESGNPQIAGPVVSRLPDLIRQASGARLERQRREQDVQNLGAYLDTRTDLSPQQRAAANEVAFRYLAADSATADQFFESVMAAIQPQQASRADPTEFARAANQALGPNFISDRIASGEPRSSALQAAATELEVRGIPVPPTLTARLADARASELASQIVSGEIPAANLATDVGLTGFRSGLRALGFNESESVEVQRVIDEIRQIEDPEQRQDAIMEQAVTFVYGSTSNPQIADDVRFMEPDGTTSAFDANVGAVYYWLERMLETVEGPRSGSQVNPETRDRIPTESRDRRSNPSSAPVGGFLAAPRAGASSLLGTSGAAVSSEPLREPRLGEQAEDPDVSEFRRSRGGG